MQVFAAGDVMTGRGVDQILPHPAPPVLYEAHLRDARQYVRLAERTSGPIARPVDAAYIWGDALEFLHQADVRLINLETSVTSSEDAWPAKGIHYRMAPGNVDCLTTARIDCCCLANNHVLDWGYAGLVETLQTLDQAQIAHAGAGESAAHAAAPAVRDLPGRGRLLVFAMGSTTSGIPPAWAATADRPGVNLLDDLSAATLQRMAAQVHAARHPGDTVVASIHWGGNWGYTIPAEQIGFAHGLVDVGVDLVHGHSSHHVKAFEVYRGRLILYGCGDFLDDYEGITGYEQFRSDLRLAYLVRIDPGLARLIDVRLVPLRARRMRLERASPADATWLCDLLNDLGGQFGTRLQVQTDGSLLLQG